MIGRLGGWCFVRRRLVLGAWLLVLAAAGLLAQVLVGPDFSSESGLPDSESASGLAVIEEFFGVQAGGLQAGSIVFRADAGVDDPRVQQAMESMFAAVAQLDGVSVTSPYDPAGALQRDRSGTVAFAALNFEPRLDQADIADRGAQIAELRPDVDGLQVEIGGRLLAEFTPPKSELVGLGFAIVVLIAAFGSVLAVGLPIGVAVFGVGVGSSLVVLVSRLVTVPDFATTLGAMLGLAVGVDYALFIVTRFRELLASGRDPLEAVVGAMSSSGRAVVFAGLTVVVSLLGMVLIGLGFVAGLGVASASVVAVTMVASVTLLPALLGFAGRRTEVTRVRGLLAAGLVAVALVGFGLSIDVLLVGLPLAVLVLFAGFGFAPLRRMLPPRRSRPAEEMLAFRWSRLIQKRPWPALLAGSFVLVLLAAPVTSLRLGFSDEGNFPPETTTRRAYDLLAEGFGPGFNGPLLVAGRVGSAAEFERLGALSEDLAADPGVAFASPLIPDDPKDPSAFVVQVIPRSAPQDQATAETVERLRSMVIPGAVCRNDGTPAAVCASTGVFLTGQTAAAIDVTGFLAGRLVLFIAVVLAVSFVLLTVVFRSLLVPLKAVVLNMVSIAAAYGVVVAIFQWGWFGSVFGVSPAPIEPFVPMMMFAIVFGLSMDYEVFLLSRVKEEFDRTKDAHRSVADGLAATARVISAAAAIMVVVFGGFLLEDNRVVKLFGVGLAVAVLLDATLVRLLLVPATMELLGARNWWLPRWLDRLLPRFELDGPAPEHAAPGGGAPQGVAEGSVRPGSRAERSVR